MSNNELTHEQRIEAKKIILSGGLVVSDNVRFIGKIKLPDGKLMKSNITINMFLDILKTLQCDLPDKSEGVAIPNESLMRFLMVKKRTVQTVLSKCLNNGLINIVHTLDYYNYPDSNVPERFLMIGFTPTYSREYKIISREGEVCFKSVDEERYNELLLSERYVEEPPTRTTVVWEHSNGDLIPKSRTKLKLV